MLKWAALLSLWIGVTTLGCGPQPTKPSFEQNLRLTYGGFLDGGDEHQQVSGVCKPDLTRTSLGCDVYNGLPNWYLTKVVIRVVWTPYGSDATRDFQEQVSIPPLTTSHIHLRLGVTLPDDTVVYGHRESHWNWIVAAASGIPK
jgi:hypothetical protein